MTNQLYRKGIIAIIIDDSNQFLLVQLKGKGKGDWNFPGGGLEKGETYESCLWRELKEELGLGENNLQLLGKSKNNHKYIYNPTLLKEKKKEGSPYIGQEKARFVLKFVGDKTNIKINKIEFHDYKWVSFGELKTYLLFPGQFDNAVSVIKELNAI
jgi:putative (di)nucleoside polyphosphate hydrolase